MRIRSFFLLTLLLGFGHSLSADILYSVTELDNLNGNYVSSRGNAINNAGQVTGLSYTSTSLAFEYHAFLYSNGQMTNLGTLGGTGYSSGWALNNNNAGQVTGYAYTSSGTRHAFLYSKGQMIDLGTSGGSSSMGLGINNSGQITGQAATSSGSQHAFLYSKGQMTDLGSLGTTNLNVGSSFGHAINSVGQVTGHSSSLLKRVHSCLPL